MEISPTTWWILAGIAVAAELATGTFYLLMLAIGLLAGAITAHMGVSLTAQLIAASVIGGGAVAGWHLYRLRRPSDKGSASNRNVSLDIGERVEVKQWDAHGRATVHYRGAAWQARYAGEGPPQPGEFTIQSIEGNRLLLVPIIPA